jgi:hypothetical protein
MKNFQEKVGFIWSVADLLPGDYKQSEYGKVIATYGPAPSGLRPGAHQGEGAGARESAPGQD